MNTSDHKFTNAETHNEEQDKVERGNLGLENKNPSRIWIATPFTAVIILKKTIPLNAPLCLVPGGADGPSGVLICSENYITYNNFGDQPDIRCPIPRRRVSP